MLALVTAFYIVGFSFSYTGARFMLHLIPFTFGWVIAGLATVSEGFSRITTSGWRARIPRSAPAIAIAVILLPQTLWPVGYDMRGVRYAGEEIARRSAGKPGAVAARDGRFAYYAGARIHPAADGSSRSLRSGSARRARAEYLALDNHDERR